MGGIGKTQLVLEFAGIHRNKFGAMWFVNAESQVKLEAGFLDMAQVLSIDLELKKNDIIRRVLITLAKQRDPWLLIYDGVVNPKDVDGFIPQGCGMVLVTSRNPCWDLYVSLLELDRLSLIELLKNMTKINEPAEADLIVNELGDLPLALCQAGCFIKQTNSDYHEYLALVKASMLDINNNDGLDSSWIINL